MTDSTERSATEQASVGHISRRRLLETGAAAGLGVATAPLLANLAPQVADAASTAPVHIRMYAQSYTPAQPTKSNPHPPTALFAVRAAYQKLHPNVTIEFLPANLGSGGQEGVFSYLTTEAAGGSAPDITWAQIANVNGGTFPAGVFYDLRPYLQKPNKYVRGNKRWIDLFDPQTLASIRGPQGQLYAIDGDYVATTYYYNKAAFAKAGIGAAPKTFAGLLAVCKKLKASGVTPMAMPLSIALQVAWWEQLGLAQFFAPEMISIDVDHEAPPYGVLPYVVGVKRGLFTAKNPRYRAIWTLFKEWSQYWAPGAATLQAGAPTAQATGPAETTLFTSGQVAMMWEGSWQYPTLRALGYGGKFGTFPVPPVTTASSPYSHNVPANGVVGGPFAAFQYYVTTPKANHAMSANQLSWVLDWLQYITTPANCATIVNDYGAFIPSIKGAQANSPQLKALVPTGKPPLSTDGVFNQLLGVQVSTQCLRLVQSYVDGSMGEQDFFAQWDSIVGPGADAWAQKNHVDLSKYLK